MYHSTISYGTIFSSYKLKKSWLKKWRQGQSATSLKTTTYNHTLYQIRSRNPIRQACKKAIRVQSCLHTCPLHSIIRRKLCQYHEYVVLIIMHTPLQLISFTCTFNVYNIYHIYLIFIIPSQKIFCYKLYFLPFSPYFWTTYFALSQDYCKINS